MGYKCATFPIIGIMHFHLSALALFVLSVILPLVLAKRHDVLPELLKQFIELVAFQYDNNCVGKASNPVEG